MLDPTLLVFAGIVLAAIVFLVTLVNTNAAITLLIFSMLLSPELPLAQLPQRAVVIRVDDLLLGLVFFSWLAKLAINKELGLIRSTPINRPLGFFTLSCAVSTILGMLTGTVTSPAAGLLYLLKYIEYFAVFFMTANVIRTRRQAVRFLNTMLLTAAVVGVLGYVQIAQYGIGIRVTAPFEGTPEPNTLAGYLVVMIGVVIGLLLYSPSGFQRFWLAGLLVLLVPTFLFTYSRGGYAAFIAMYLALCLFSKRFKPILIFLLLISVIAVPLLVPATVIGRLQDVFDPVGGYEFMGVRLAQSPSFRVMVWGWIIERVIHNPLFGYGLTGVGIVDSQHALVLGEQGLLGVLTYLWVRWRLWTVGYRIFKTTGDRWLKGLTLGFLAAFIGLLVHSFAANVFIIVRVMEPFWFLAALIVVLPRVLSEEASTTPPMPRA